MPRRKGTNLAQLLKKHKNKGRKSNKRKSPKKKKNNPKVLRLKNLKKKLIDQKKVNLFLTSIVEDDDDDHVLLMTKKFVRSGNDFYLNRMREKFFFGKTGPLTLLPMEAYRVFVIAYLNQPKKKSIRKKVKGRIVQQDIKVNVKDLDTFWNDYLEKPEIMEIIEEYSEEKEMGKILDNLEEDQEIIESIPPNKKKSLTKSLTKSLKKSSKKNDLQLSTIMVEMVTDNKGKPVIGENGQPILRKINRPVVKSDKLLLSDNSKCIKTERNAPWIDYKVHGIYILPLNQLLVQYYTDVKEYVTVQINKKTIKLYKATNNFFKLLCSIQSNRNIQKDNIFIGVTPGGEKVEFYVSYKVVKDEYTNLENEKGWKLDSNSMLSKIIIQDEYIFKQKKKWYLKHKSTRKTRIDQLLEGPVTQKLTNLGINRLNIALTRIVGDNQYHFSKDSSNAITLNSNTAKEYINKLSFILAFLDTPNANIFRARVKDGWYRPSTFVSLTPGQMLPNTNEADEEFNAKIIVRRQKREAASLTEKYYQIQNPTETIPTISNNYPFYQNIKISDWRLKCENRDYIIDIPDYKLIPYEENGKIYCLDIDYLRIKINELALSGPIEESLDKIKNPYTNKKLNTEFVRELINTEFDGINWEENDEEIQVKKINKEDNKEDNEEDPKEDPKEDNKEDKKEVILTPGLFSLVLRNIKDCNKELVDGNIDSEGRCLSLNDGTEFSEGNATLFEEEGNASVVEDTDEDTEEDTEEEDSEDIEEEDIEEEDNEDESEEDSEDESEDESDEESDYYTPSSVNPVLLKTKVLTDNGYKTKTFSSVSELTEFKFPKQRKKRSSVAGGRNGTRERKNRM